MGKSRPLWHCECILTSIYRRLSGGVCLVGFAALSRNLFQFFAAAADVFPLSHSIAPAYKSQKLQNSAGFVL